MRFRRTLFALLAGAVLSLFGCATPAPENSIRTLQGGDGGSLPRQLAGQTLALDRFGAPPELAGQTPWQISAPCSRHSRTCAARIRHGAISGQRAAVSGLDRRAEQWCTRENEPAAP